MSSLQMFIPLTKVDVPNRLVYGVATAEKLDRAGEICDYASTKPFYEKWSQAIHKASGGKSVGNLRSMHAKIAAGKLTAINFDDANTQIEIIGKVVDDAEWNKVLEGVYTGFSQGGNYFKRWRDAAGYQRYTAEPTEISLVDLPCLAEATFQVIKAEGVIEKAHFRSGTITDPSLLPSLGTGEDPAPIYKDRAGGEQATAGMAKAANAALEQAALDAAAQANPWLAKINAKLDAVLAGTTALTPPAAPTPTPVQKAAEDDKEKKPYGDVEYADTGFQEDKKHRYPIDTEEHIRAAWSYINKKKNADAYSAADLKTVKDRIIAAWKDKIDKDGPPSADEKSFKAGELKKGLYNVSRLACLIEELVWLQESTVSETAWEGDNSTIPAELKASIAALVMNLRNMVVEETNELFTPLDVDALGEEFVVLLEMAYGGIPNRQRTAIVKVMQSADKLKKATAAMLKVGARHNAADMERIQKMHDTACELGANCGDPMETPDAGGTDTSSSTGDPKVGKGTPRAALVKLLAARDQKIAELEKAAAAQTDGHNAELAKILARIEKLEKAPAPPKGVVFAVGKEQDNGAAVGAAVEGGAQPVRKLSIREQAALIKDPRERATFILSNGQYAPGGGHGR